MGLRDASASKNSTIEWIYGISKNTLGSQRSQKIFWDLKDLKKYFEISKISKNTLGSQNIRRSQKISSDLKKILNIWTLRKYSTIVRSLRSQKYFRISNISKIDIQIVSGRYLWTYPLQKGRWTQVTMVESSTKKLQNCDKGK